MKILFFSLLTLLLSEGCARKKLSRYQPGQLAGQNSAADGPLADALESDAISGEAASDPGLNLVWKRYRAFEDGLSRGLELPKDKTCSEIGQHSCVDKVHLTSLGGNEPFVLAQWERSQAPSVLTSVAVDRMVLAACNNRLQLDKTAGTAAFVFKHFPLAEGSPLPNAGQIKAQATELYQRLLARDPEGVELELVTSFGSKAAGAEQLALILCYAVGSSSENIFL